MADSTSTSVGIILNGKDNASQAFESATRAAQKFEQHGISGLNEKLERLKGSLRGFNSILELGFGFQVGRKLFEQIHEAAVNIGEGFAEARKEGMEFWDSVADGIRKAAGIKTLAAEAKELKTAFKEGLGFMYSAESKGTALFKRLGIGSRAGSFGELSPSGPSEFEKLSPAEAAAADDYFDSVRASKKKMIEGKYGEAAERLGAHQQMLADYEAGRGTPGMAIGLIAAGIAPSKEGLRAAIERDKKALSELQSQIVAIDAMAAGARQKLLDLIDGREQWKKITGVLLGGPSGSTDTTAGMFRRLGVQAGGITDTIDSTASSGLRGLIGILGRGAIGLRDPSIPNEINNAITDLQLNNTLSPQQKQLEAAKIVQGFGSYFGINRGDKAAGSVGAQNQRFLNYGSGSAKTPELTALEKIESHLAQLGEQKMSDLITALKGFGPIGVIDDQ